MAMYPFASLPENLAAFCGVLRRNHGFRVGPRELHDAARALQLTPIADERAVRDVLRPILSRTADDAAAFDRAFRAFFHPGVPRLERPAGAAERAGRGSRPATHDVPSRGMEGEPEPQPADDPAGDRTRFAEETGGTEGAPSGRTLRSAYSAADAEGLPLDLAPPDAAWRSAAAVFVARVETALSRRWRPARRGPRFDLRRTLRASFHTGAEAVLPRWQARPRLRPQFVLVVDGSRSMAPHTRAALQLAVAIAGAAPGVAEVFVFSTQLRAITRDVRRAAAGERRVLIDLRHAWAGGTGIGHSLRDLVHRHGRHALGRDTVVLVVSDGLDLGAPETLRHAMAEIHRRSAAIVWLNPLAETAGYEPTALGMRVARPFVSTFGWAGDPESLVRLARRVRVRRG